MGESLFSAVLSHTINYGLIYIWIIFWSVFIKKKSTWWEKDNSNFAKTETQTKKDNFNFAKIETQTKKENSNFAKTETQTKKDNSNKKGCGCE